MLDLCPALGGEAHLGVKVPESGDCEEVSCGEGTSDNHLPPVSDLTPQPPSLTESGSYSGSSYLKEKCVCSMKTEMHS